MTDPLPSRGAFTRLALVIALGLAAVASADAQRLARAAPLVEPLCTSDLAAAQSLVAAWGGGALIRIDDDLVAGLRAIDVDSAEADVAGPVAMSDRAFVAQLPDGVAAYVFALGDKVCGGVEILPRGALPALNRAGVAPARAKL